MDLRAPSRIERISTLRLANLDGAFATAFITLVTGVFLVGFVQSLGGSDIWIGVLTAIPSLAGFLQIPGAIWGRQFRSYKPFIWPGGLLWRLLYIPLILLPFLAIGSGIRLWLLTLLVAVASALLNLVNPSYNDWLAELVPANSRGFYFSRRNAIMTAVGAAAGIVGAVLLDAIRVRAGDRLGFSVVFGIGVVCAGASYFFFSRMPDLGRAHPIRAEFRTALKAIAAPFADRPYRNVLVFLAFSTLGQMFAGNLFVAYARESLHLSYFITQGTAVSMAIGNILTASAWGFVADKYGNKPLLTLAGIALSLNMIPWLLTRPGLMTYDAVLLLSTHVLMGMTWCGLNLCQFNLMLATAKPEDRANYLGAGMTVTALLGGIAPVVGALLMSHLRLGFTTESAYKIVFIVTGILRFGAVFVLIPVREQGSLALGTAIRDLRGMTPRRMLAVRTLTRATDVSDREDAIASVGESRISLASEEIIRALHDPLPSVRREASQALARLSDPRAVDELVHQLEDHPDLLEEETVQALGTLGHPAAVPALINLLSSPTSAIRRAAARALGQIATNVEGESRLQLQEALAKAAEDATDPDLRRAALQGLRKAGSSDCAAVVGSALMDPLPSVRIAAAEACSELGLTTCRPMLRASMTEFPDEAAAEVAYALGCVGEFADMNAILEAAQKFTSIITRRRALLGAARLLGVQSEVYRLMLLNEMPRDAALLEITRGVARRHRELRPAIKCYTEGNESEALRLISEARADAAYVALAKTPVEEAFLVAVCALAAQD